MSEEVGNRLKLLIKSNGFTNKTFAKEASVAANYISILIRTGKISDKFKYTITKVIPNININWLESGKGDMYLKLNTNSLNTPFFDKEGNSIGFEELALYVANNDDELIKYKVYRNIKEIDVSKRLVEITQSKETLLKYLKE